MNYLHPPPNHVIAENKEDLYADPPPPPPPSRCSKTFITAFLLLSSIPLCRAVFISFPTLLLSVLLNLADSRYIRVPIPYFASSTVNLMSWAH